MKRDYYIGLDLGKQSSYFVVKDPKGKILQKMKVFNDSETLKRAFQPFTTGRCMVVMEATCNYYWMYQQLSDLGMQIKLAHPLKTKAIASAKIKNDRLDATILSDLLRADLIPESYIPPEDIRDLRELTRQHIRLVQIRTQIKNQFHALLTKLNLKPAEDYSDTFGKKGREWLSTLTLPGSFELQKRQLIEQVEHYNHLIQQVAWQIEKELRHFPQAARLQELPGIGKFAAALIIAEIGDIKRFPDAKRLIGYAGLAPGLYESGATSHSRGITKQGNKYLRWILCEAAQHHIRKPGELRTFYLRLLQSKGHGKAITATARKLLIKIYHQLNQA
jgi:transposase